MLASGALFLACKAMNYSICPRLMEKQRNSLDIFTKKEFSSCLKKMKTIWQQIKTTTTYSNYDAVYKKYIAKYGFGAKNVNIPTYEQQDIEGWFYTK